MYEILRALLFSLPPHVAHAVGVTALGPAEYVAPVRAALRAVFCPSDPRLAVRAMGLTFPSPVGLAGGFDKNAQRPRALAALGFGFVELGTVTARAQDANPTPNLFRLPEDRALVNRLGFPNEGAERVARRIAARAAGVRVPIGVSIGKSRAVDVEPIEPAIADYVASFRAVRDVADFVVVNVSSPNTKNLRALQGAEIARALFSTLVRENADGARKPLLVKLAPDLADRDIDALTDVVRELDLDGVIATNTTIGREGLRTERARVDAIGAGGLSGPPIRARALDVVGRVRARLGPEKVVVGVGGIETAAHALAFFEAGATLVQLYTGFIYEGPAVAKHIAEGLIAAVEKRGAASLEELCVARRS